MIGRRNAAEKVALFLIDLADFLGLTIETVSRTLSRLARDKQIVVVSDGVRLLNVTRMEALTRIETDGHPLNFGDSAIAGRRLIGSKEEATQSGILYFWRPSPSMAVSRSQATRPAKPRGGSRLKWEFLPVSCPVRTWRCCDVAKRGIARWNARRRNLRFRVKLSINRSLERREGDLSRF
jgi:hypothetical protein